MQAFLDQISTWLPADVAAYLPKLAAALGVLIVGWILALIVSWLVRMAINKTPLNNSLGKFMSSSDGRRSNAGAPIGKIVFYVMMAFVLIAFFQTLGLTVVTKPLEGFLSQLFEYAPRVFGAGVLGVVGWFVARIARMLVHQGLTAADADNRLGNLGNSLSNTTANVVNRVNESTSVPELDQGHDVSFGSSSASSIPLTKPLSEGVFFLVLLLFLPAVLGALQMQGLLTPIQELVNKMVGLLPGIFGALVVLGISFFIGKIVSGLVSSLLAGVGFNELPNRLGFAASNLSSAPEGRQPSDLVGKLILATFVLFAAMQALPMMGLDMLAGMMNEFLVFASQIFLGLFILALGLYLSKLAADAIIATGMDNAQSMAKIARIAIIVLAGAMGLRRMGLADEIVNLAFGLTLGAIAVGCAIAFGWGGRDAAKRMIDGYFKASA